MDRDTFRKVMMSSGRYDSTPLSACTHSTTIVLGLTYIDFFMVWRCGRQSMQERTTFLSQVVLSQIALWHKIATVIVCKDSDSGECEIMNAL